MLNLCKLKEILPQCCDADFINISKIKEKESNQLKEFLPDFKTVIILAHHLTHSLEWTWYKFEPSRSGVMAPADLHLFSEAQKITSNLEKEGYQSVILPYPGICGIRFKDLANKTGLGEIGDNFLFLHKDWGPWVHLRVILTNADITDHLPPCESVCIHCGACRNACPANAIQNNELLGNECSIHQKEIADDIDAYSYKCEICARACPIGIAPKIIHIQ